MLPLGMRRRLSPSLCLLLAASAAALAPPAPSTPPRTGSCVGSVHTRYWSAGTFGVLGDAWDHRRSPPPYETLCAASHVPDDDVAGSDDAGGASAAGRAGGDKIRAATGIRPSLHPTTINAVSDALLMRSSSKSNTGGPVDVWAEDVQPLEVALTAGKIAADALERRSASCQADGDEDSAPTPEECQVVAGRVVGVVMRLRELEAGLANKVGKAGWVKKYDEHGTFGVLKSECDAGEDENKGEGGGIVVDPIREAELCERIRGDPLFRMCRAECLIALFIHHVEIPTLQRVEQDVAGGSQIDFIDEDRREVLLS